MTDEARAKRAAALEEKKRRLEELKARRANRVPAVAAATSSSSSLVGDDDSEKAAAGGNLDDYIDGLLKSAAPAVVPIESDDIVDDAAPSAVQTTATDSVKETKVAAVEPVPSTEEAAAAPVAPPPKKVETFVIGTQTEEEDFPPPSVEDEDEKKESDEEKKAREKIKKGEEQKEHGEELNEKPLPPPKILNPEEREAALKSPPFSTFLNTASKKVERLLGAHVLADLLVDADYSGETDEEAEAAERKVDHDAERRWVASRHAFECPRWTIGRDITDLEWSPVHRELLLSSYHAPAAALYSSASASGSAITAIKPDDTPSFSLAPRSGELRSDGLVLIWNLAMPNRPEHIFTCGSPVLSARFHPTEHHLLVGGCQSGQLAVWDIRAGRLPVQRSSLAVAPGGGGGLSGHAHPVCAVEIVEGGSGLVTAATDGQLNFWSLANLRDPAESLMVRGNISSLAVAPEGNAVICGDENGSLHTIVASSGAAAASSAGGGTSSSRSSTSRRTVRKLDVGEDGAGHFGMVTAVATKVSPRNSGGTASGSRAMSRSFLRGSSGLVLTCGVDWTTKLWAPAYTDKPLLSFLSSSYDYMCDVQWSPMHPAVFATASSNGSLGLWNLASSLDEPISGSEGIVIDTDDTSTPRGLNKIRWSADGRRIVVASADELNVLAMSEEISRPKGDEDGRMMSNLISRGLLEEE